VRSILGVKRTHPQWRFRRLGSPAACRTISRERESVCGYFLEQISGVRPEM